MSKVSVNKNSFLSFLKLLALKGQIENKEVLLNVSKDTIHGSLVSSDRSLAASAFVFGEFEDIGSVGIDNLQQLIQIVNSMGNEFDISFSSNKLIVSNKKSKLTNVLRSAEYIVNKLDTDRYNKILTSTENGIKFIMNKEMIKDIVTKFKLIDSEELSISSNGKEIKVKSKNTNDETELETIYDIETKDKFSIKLNKLVIDLFDTIDCDLTVTLAKENPACISFIHRDENIQFGYIVALLVQDEETVDESKEKIKIKKK